MSTILEEICARKRIDLDTKKQETPPRELYRRVERLIEDETPIQREGRDKRRLSAALLASDTGIIAEFKRKSPSKGWIKEDGRPDIIPPAYQKAGATALSILTDEPNFGGSNIFLETARPLVSIPILRKDFTVDEYQLFEARLMYADAVLLIAACLKKDECRSLAHTARELGLETLLEVHSEQELDYLNDDISVLGVNNRNLHVFQTDIQTSVDLATKIPAEFVHISESGLHTAEDVKMLRMCGYRGFLMGERFMREDDPGAALKDFISELTTP